MPYSVQTHRLARSLALLVALAGAIAGWSLTSATPAQASSGPGVRTEPAETVPNGARLKGELNPGELPTTYYFEYNRASPTCDEGCKPRTTAVAGPLTGSTPQEVPPVEVTGLTAGETYWYQLIASNAEGTTAGQVLEFTVPTTPNPPSEVQTEPAEATTNGFVLKGELNPDGLPTTYYFEYSENPIVDCDELCPFKTAVGGPLTGAVLQYVAPVEITGLTPGGKYRYRLVASNADGTTDGEVREFTTAATTGNPPSEVQTEPAEATANGVLLKGELNPGDLPTTYYFEYASFACDEGCKPSRTAVAGPLTGSTRQEVPQVEVTGLVPGDKYWYQLVASNADGTREGAGRFLEFTGPATPERPSEVQTEPESKSDPPALLVSPPTVTSPPGGTTTAPTPLTRRARKLANALIVCGRKPKRQRARCDRRAQMRYGTAARATKKTGRQARNGKK